MKRSKTIAIDKSVGFNVLDFNLAAFIPKYKCYPWSRLRAYLQGNVEVIHETNVPDINL